MINAPKRFYEVALGEHKHKLRLTINSLRKLEESVGKSYQELMNDMETDGIGVLINFLWAGSLPFDPAFTKEAAAELLDAMIDHDMDIMDLNKTLFEILKVSGLLPKSFDIDSVLEDQLDQLNGEEDAPK